MTDESRGEEPGLGSVIVKRVYYVLSPLPVAGFILAIRHYSERTKGWGTWGTVGSIAVFFVGVGTILGVVGLVLTLWFRRRGEPVLGLSTDGSRRAARAAAESTTCRSRSRPGMSSRRCRRSSPGLQP